MSGPAGALNTALLFVLRSSVVSLFHPMDCSPPGSSVHGILLARILEWVAIPASRGINPGITPASLTPVALVGGFFVSNAIWEAPTLHHYQDLILGHLYL